MSLKRAFPVVDKVTNQLQTVKDKNLLQDQLQSKEILQPADRQHSDCLELPKKIRKVTKTSEETTVETCNYDRDYSCNNNRKNSVGTITNNTTSGSDNSNSCTIDNNINNYTHNYIYSNHNSEHNSSSNSDRNNNHNTTNNNGSSTINRDGTDVVKSQPFLSSPNCYRHVNHSLTAKSINQNNNLINSNKITSKEILDNTSELSHSEGDPTECETTEQRIPYYLNEVYPRLLHSSKESAVKLAEDLFAKLWELDQYTAVKAVEPFITKFDDDSDFTDNETPSPSGFWRLQSGCSLNITEDSLGIELLINSASYSLRLKEKNAAGDLVYQGYCNRWKEQKGEFTLEIIIVDMVSNYLEGTLEVMEGAVGEDIDFVHFEEFIASRIIISDDTGEDEEEDDDVDHEEANEREDDANPRQ